MSQEQLAYIERYWAQELSEEELQDFQIRYKTDPAFASQVDLFREAKDAIEVLGQQKLKESFRKKYKTEQSTEQQTGTLKIKKLPVRWMFVAAAAIALLLVFVLWQQNNPSSLSPTELYTQYYSFEALSLERGTDETDSLFVIANEAYNAKAFDQAIPILQNLLEDGNFSRKDYALLHLGISQLEISEDSYALNTLSKISEESSFHVKAQWNMALIYLKQSEDKKARPILEMLIKNSRVYGKQAQEILERL